MPKYGDVAALWDLENGPEWHAARSPIFEATYKKLKYGRASPGDAARALHGCVKAHECVTVSMLRPLWAAEEPFCGAARAGGGRRSALRWRYRRPGAFQSAARTPHELAEVA